MRDSDFALLVQDQLKTTQETLTKKGVEYGRGDRLHNFKVIAKMRGVTPESACIGLVSKQWVAALDMVNDINHSVEHSMAAWEEKIGDIIAYMILLKALVAERHINSRPLVMLTNPSEFQAIRSKVPKNKTKGRKR